MMTIQSTPPAAHTAMVVEDEGLVRLIATECLNDAGFEVIEATDADNALALLQAGGSKIDLLFTDVNMPGPLNGLDLARQVRTQWPHIAVLVSSGRSLPASPALPAGSWFMAKPYGYEQLVNNARSMTDHA